MVEEYGQAQVEKGGTALVWLLPLIAALIAGWLLYKGLSEAGVTIYIDFESAEGIEENRTKILYKGLNVGIVKKVTINADLKSVLVEAEMRHEVASHLLAGTQFWLVRPKVSLTEVTGLDTIVSGNYIAVSPGEGEITARFKALTKRPPTDDSSPGLHIHLRTETLDSVEVGSPVYYRQIPVGRVEEVDLEKDGKEVLITVYIDEQYAHLVKKSARFWNVSGINFKADLSGVEIQTSSLASIIAGGIAFYTPAEHENAPLCENGDRFTLYKNYNNAEDGIMVSLTLPEGETVIAGKTSIKSNGLEVGIVKRVKINSALQSIVEVKFHPHAKPLLRENARLWLVEPNLSLSQLPSISSLLEGKYIEIKGGDGAPKYRFDVLKKRPDSDRSKTGLYLTLIATELGSLERGSPVLYRKIKVGRVEGFQLDSAGRFVEIQLYVMDKYSYLVKKQSRFWNASGLKIEAGLDGFKLRTGSLSTLIGGGVAFFNPSNTKQAAMVARDERFKLYEDKESAEYDSFPVEVIFDSAGGLQVGAAVKFQGLKVGKIKTIELTGEGGEVAIQLSMYRKSRGLIQKGSKFWVVKPQLGLTRIDNLDAVILGHYIALKPGKGGGKNSFKGLSSALADDTLPGLQLTLVASRLGSIKRGDPIYYRQIAVGRVTETSLSPKTDAVFIQVIIEKKYAPLIRDNSRFWKVSGVRMEASLFGGVKIETESIEAILSGGIAFATPPEEQMGSHVTRNHIFELNDKMAPIWGEWKSGMMLPLTD